MNIIFYQRLFNVVSHKCFSLLVLSPALNSFSVGSINHAPVFKHSNYSYTISEQVAPGTFLGNSSAIDQDGDKLTYSIKSGNTNSSLSINATTGAIIVAKRLNYHTQGSYTLTIKVTDPKGLSNEALVNILVRAGAELPNFNAIKWSSSVSQPYKTHELPGVVVNGKLYIFGGYDILKRPNYVPTKRAFVFDPTANKWKSIADLPYTPNGLNFGGASNEGITTDGTDIYFAGGYICNSRGTVQVFGSKEVWKYNVKSNTYTALPNLPIELAAGQLRYLKGKIHFMAGANKSRSDVNVHYALDLDNLSSGWKKLATVPNARNYPGGAVYEGKIYLIGGAHHQGSSSIKQKTVEAYDPDTDSWKAKADLPIGVDHILSSVVVIGNRILVLGGETAPNVKSNKVQAYSPADNKWTSLTSMSLAKSSGVAAVLNNVIYYTGGNFSNLNRKGAPLINHHSRPDSLTLNNTTIGEEVRVNAQNFSPLTIETNAGDKKPSTTNISLISDSTPSITEKSSKNLASLLFETPVKIKVYPNPLQKTFNVEFAVQDKGIYDLQIIDALGRIYKLGKSNLQAGLYHKEIDVSSLSLKKGIYFIRIYSDRNQTGSTKLIIE